MAACLSVCIGSSAAWANNKPAFNPFGNLRPPAVTAAQANQSAMHGMARPANADASSQRREHLDGSLKTAREELATTGHALATAARNLETRTSELRNAEHAVSSAESDAREVGRLREDLSKKQRELNKTTSELKALASGSGAKSKSKPKAKQAKHEDESQSAQQAKLDDPGHALPHGDKHDAPEAAPSHGLLGGLLRAWLSEESSSPEASTTERRAELERRRERLRGNIEDLGRSIERTAARASSVTALKSQAAQARKAVDEAESTHSALATKQTRLKDEVVLHEASLDEWTKAAKYVQVDRVRGTLDKLRDAQSTPKLSPRWGARVFSTEKASAVKPNDNRDAISIVERDGALSIAVADGSSVGPLTGPWARLVASGFTGELHALDGEMPKVGALPALDDKASLKTWLEPLHTQWNHLLEAESPFARNAIRTNGGMTTLVGVNLKREASGAWTYHASAAGDSNLFVVRKGKLIHSWPMRSTEEFDSSPMALSFLLEKNPAEAWKSTSGALQEGDEIVMTTDALAKWVLQGGNKAATRLGQLSKVTDAAAFQQLVDGARTQRTGAMIDDDTSMVRMVVPSAKEKE